MSQQIVKSDPFWLNDFKILIEKSRLIEFFPTYDMTISEKLNAITRLMFYISIVLMIYTQNVEYIFLFILTCIVTILLDKYLEKEPVYSEDPVVQEGFSESV